MFRSLFLKSCHNYNYNCRGFHVRSLKLAETSSTASTSGGPVLNLRFVTPNETIVNNKPVYMCTIPAVTGVMGILADHAPTIAQLKPGLVTVHNSDINDISHRYFVSGGFAVVKPDNSASVTAVEAIKLDDLDLTAAKKGLDDSNSALIKANNDSDKAAAQISIEVYEAIVNALEQK